MILRKCKVRANLASLTCVKMSNHAFGFYLSSSEKKCSKFVSWNFSEYNGIWKLSGL